MLKAFQRLWRILWYVEIVYLRQISFNFDGHWLRFTYFLSLRRNVSNSTDILQHSAWRKCPLEQFVLIMWPSERRVERKRENINSNWFGKKSEIRKLGAQNFTIQLITTPFIHKKTFWVNIASDVTPKTFNHHLIERQRDFPTLCTALKKCIPIHLLYIAIPLPWYPSHNNNHNTFVTHYHNFPSLSAGSSNEPGRNSRGGELTITATITWVITGPGCPSKANSRKLKGNLRNN